VDDGTVTDGDELAKPRLVRRIDVNDGIVLNVGARAESYPIDITAQKRRTIRWILPSALRRR
jgi:hypothetical protein